MSNGTKTKILEAAERLLVERGFEKFTLRAVTTAAGVNLAAVNYHFGSKAGLEEALLVRVFAPIEQARLERLRELEAGGALGADDLEALVRCLAEPMHDFFLEHPQHLGMFMGIYQMFGDPERFRIRMGALIAQSRKAFGDALQRICSKASPELLRTRLALISSILPALLDPTFHQVAWRVLELPERREQHLDDAVAFLMASLSDLLPPTRKPRRRRR